MSKTITLLLEKWRKGDDTALSELIPIVYEQLHVLASKYLREERKDHTLQPTALINEALIYLLKDDTSFANRSHFMAIVANTMRRVLVDYARKRTAQKRQGNILRISLKGFAKGIMTQDIDLVALDEALTKLESIDNTQMKIVELRFFCGLTIEETSTILEISPTTVKVEWAMAKAWLYRELTKN